jgi:uncharacterized protein (DUF697 family)/predicted GTPase
MIAKKFEDVGEIIKDKLEDALKQRGIVNIIIAGKTGVGKSTLINAIFQGNIATTGQGKPVTKETRKFTKKYIPVAIYDTKGLELDKYDETIKSLNKVVKEQSAESDPKEHIHLALVCLSEDSHRVEDGEIKTVEMLSNYMPVIAVITKAKSDNGFKATVSELLPKAKNVIRVRVLPDNLDDGHVLLPMGLEDLVELMMEVAPEGQQQALAAAQKVNIKKKVEQSNIAVVIAASAAAATGATPIPFSDAALLAPIEIGLLTRISVCFGLKISSALLYTLLSSITGVTAATIGGKALVSWLLKASGVGYIAGAAISGATAAMLTTTIGQVYILVLKQLFEKHDGEPPTEDEIAEEFNKSIKNNIKK